MRLIIDNNFVHGFSISNGKLVIDLPDGTPVAMVSDSTVFAPHTETLAPAPTVEEKTERVVMTLGQRVAVWRRRTGHTQGQVASHLGVSQGFVSQIETGRADKVSDALSARIREMLAA